MTMTGQTMTKMTDDPAPEQVRYGASNDPSTSLDSARDKSLGASKHGAYFLLESIYKECLKMLHPFMPFVTEEVFGHLNLGDGLLMTEAW